MLLNRLIEQQDRLIEQGKLSPIMDFESRRIDFLLILDPRGRVVDIRDGMDERVWLPVVERSANIRSNLLWDTAEYVLGIPSEKKGASAKKSASEKAQERLGDAIEAPRDGVQTFKSSLWLIRESVRRSGESYPALDAIIAFYEKDHLADVLADPRMKPVYDRCAEGVPPGICFALREDGADDEDFEIAATVPGLSEHLVQARLETSERVEVVCSITGKRGLRADYHGSIRGVLNSAPTGARLVSFNEGNADGFGFSDAENCVTTIDTARGYHRALNYLLSHNVLEGGRRHYPHHYHVGDGSKIGDYSLVVWSANDIAPTNVFFAKEPEEELLKLRRLFRAAKVEGTPKAMTRADGSEPEFFFAGLRGNRARLSNVLWREMSAHAFLEAAERWYADMETASPYEDGDRRVVIWKLVDAVSAAVPAAAKLTSDQKAVKAAKAEASNGAKSAPAAKKTVFQRRLEGRLFRAAITPDEALPADILAHVIRYCKTTLLGLHGVGGSATQIGFDTRLHRIASLIKLALARSANPVRLPVSLDPEYPNGIYHLGRLFALCEKAQERAVPDVNASIFARFAGAMASPAFVMTPVLRKNGKHLDSLRRNALTHRSYLFFRNRITDVSAKAPIVFPTTLTLQDQGIFYQGYYHERHELRRLAVEAAERAKAGKPPAAQNEADIGSDDLTADAPEASAA